MVLRASCSEMADVVQVRSVAPSMHVHESWMRALRQHRAQTPHCSVGNCCAQDGGPLIQPPVPEPGAIKSAARRSPDSTDTGVKMDQGPAKSDSRSDSGTGGGLVNNTQPMTVRGTAAI